MGQGRKRDPVLGLFLTLAAWPVLVVVYAFLVGLVLIGRAAQGREGDVWFATGLTIAIAYIVGSFHAGAWSGVLSAKAEVWFMLSLLINLGMGAGCLAGGIWILDLGSGVLSVVLTVGALAAPALGRFAYERFCRKKNEPGNPGDASSAV